MKFKIYEVEVRATASGKELKKLVVQGEGKQYPDKNVTMWSDHPLYNSINVGQEIEAELDVRDSTTPNPKGGFYKNKTFLSRGAAPAPVQSSETGARAQNIMTFEILPRLDKILAKLDRIERFTCEPEVEIVKEKEFKMPSFDAVDQESSPF